MHFNESDSDDGNYVGVGVDNNDDNDNYRAWKITTSRSIILSGVFTNFIAVLIAFTVREIKVDGDSNYSMMMPETNECPADANAEEDDDKGDCLEDRSSMMGTNVNGVSEFQPIRESSLKIIGETIRTPNFRRFLLLTLLTTNVKMVFRHL